MPWLKKAGEAPKNEKIWELSDPLYRLYDASLHYCAENLSDGHVPTSRISPLTPKPAAKRQVDALVNRRLWHRLPDICKSCLELRKAHGAGPLPRGGYIVHDYLAYNPSRAEWEGGQLQRKSAGRVGAQARWGSNLNGGPHSESHGESDSGAHSESHSEPHPKTPKSDSEPHGGPLSGRHAPYPVPRTTEDEVRGGPETEPDIPDDPPPQATDRKRSGTRDGGGLRAIGTLTGAAMRGVKRGA